MNATLRFLPSASSPSLVAYPSQSICPLVTLSPLLTIGRRVIDVLWFVFLNLVSLYTLTSPSKLRTFSSSVRLYRITISFASTRSTVPVPSALISTLENSATLFSRPVPTTGASGLISGTAWRCMFEPISARLASSCSKNGISDAAIDAIWLGATSIRLTLFFSVIGKSPLKRTFTKDSENAPESEIGVLEGAIILLSSSSLLNIQAFCANLLYRPLQGGKGFQ